MEAKKGSFPYFSKFGTTLFYIALCLLVLSVAWFGYTVISKQNAAINASVTMTKEAIAKLRFQNGQIVESVLTGQRGQVIERGPMGYIVRFQAVEYKTNTKLLGADGPISVSPFSDVHMKDFELRESK